MATVAVDTAEVVVDTANTDHLDHFGMDFTLTSIERKSAVDQPTGGTVSH